MKIASKFIAALAVVASFSSFAADSIDTSAGVTDMATAIELAEAGATVIFQTGSDSFASIEQSGGLNTAVIAQMTDGAAAAIVQKGEGNVAIIVQGE
jgi:hypothetical protein